MRKETVKVRSEEPLLQIESLEYHGKMEERKINDEILGGQGSHDPVVPTELWKHGGSFIEFTLQWRESARQHVMGGGVDH